MPCNLVAPIFQLVFSLEGDSHHLHCLYSASDAHKCKCKWDVVKNNGKIEMKLEMM